MFSFYNYDIFIYPGSHDFQNITVSSSSPGEIGVTGDFIPGSLAIGVLIVVYSADNIINYHFIHRFSIHTSSLTNPLVANIRCQSL